MSVGSVVLYHTKADTVSSAEPIGHRRRVARWERDDLDH